MCVWGPLYLRVKDVFWLCVLYLSGGVLCSGCRVVLWWGELSWCCVVCLCCVVLRNRRVFWDIEFICDVVEVLLKEVVF